MSTTQQVTATPRNSSGTAITGKTTTWTSTNTAVATVSNTGLVTAVGPGGCEIRATVDGIVGISGCEVNTPAVQSYFFFTFSGNNTVQRGQSVTFAVSLTRVNGYTGNITVTAPTGLNGLTATVGLTENSLGSTVVLSGSTPQFFVRLTADAGAALGSQAVNLTSSGVGGVVANLITQANVVNTAAPAINGTLSTNSLNVTRGTPGTVTLTVVRSGGFTGAITPVLETSSLGGNFPTNEANGTLGTVSFSPTTIAAGTTSCTISVNIPTGWVAGTSTPFFQVRLTGEGVASQVLPAITVNVS